MRLRALAGLVGALAVASIAAHMLGFILTGTAGRSAVYSGWLLAGLAAVVGCAAASRRATRGPVRRAWAFWTLAASVWLLGTVYRFTINDHVPSLGGKLWIVAAVLILAGVAAGAPGRRTYLLFFLDALPVIAAVVVLLDVTVEQHADAAEKVELLPRMALYLFLGLVGLELAARLVERRSVRLAELPLAVSLLAFGAAGIAWPLYAYGTVSATTAWPDALWTLALVALALAGVARTSRAADRSQIEPLGTGHRWRAIAPALALPVLLAIVYLAPSASQQHLFWIGVAALAAFGARHYIAHRSATHLLADLERTSAVLEHEREELGRSEALFRAYFEHASIGMCLTSPDGRYLRVNQALADMLGYLPEELIGRTFASVTHAADVWANIELIKALLGGERDSVELEKRYIRRDGTSLPVLITSSVARDEAGAAALVVTQVQDLTRRKEAEKRQQEAESRYRTLVEQLPLVVYIDALDERSSNIYTSPQTEAMLGYSPEEWRRDPGMFEKLLHPDDRQRVLALVNADDEPFRAEYRLVARNGREVWVRDEAVIVAGPDGEPLHAQGYLLDITERKQAEERLQDAEERYRTLVEEIPAVIYACEPGPTGRWLYVSPSIEALIGVPPEDWLAHEAPFSAFVHPEDRERVAAEEDASLADGGTVQSEYRMVKRDGGVVWIRDQAHIVRAGDGRALYLRGFLVDATEQKAAEEALWRTQAELEAQNERLRELDRLKDEFVALVSHELRTPLTSIHGYLELILDDEAGALGAEQRRFLEIVDRNAQRLQRLVGDLLFVAQADAGRLSLEETPVDLGLLAAECAEAAIPAAGEKGVRIDVTSGEIGPVWADRARIAQLLDNLISNAVKFTPDGGRVEVRVTRENGTALLEVADSGIGIPEDEQQHLFERFFRTSTATRQAIQGTGLGLAITKAIAERHGGRVSVESAAGEGATFRVELPLRPPEAARAS